MQVSITASGLLDPAKLRAWTNAQQAKVRSAVTRAMRAEGKAMSTAAQQQAAQAFGGKQRAAKSIRFKLYDSKPAEMPALKIGSKVPWLGLHEKGGTVSGKMLIPFGDSRPRGFRKLIGELMRGGNAYFNKVGNHAILFAENIPENAGVLRAFKRTARNLGIVETRGKTGKTIKRGTDIPVAVLVKRVTMKKRLKLESTVKRGLPALARAIEKELARG
jgi:hypothetical protein